MSNMAHGGGGKRRTVAPLLSLLLFLLSSSNAAPRPGRLAAANWLCTPSSGNMCQQLPGNGAVFKVSMFRVYRGGMMSPQHFITGAFSVQLRLPMGNSGGTSVNFGLADTNTASNADPRHTEIAMTFYGNTTARLIMLATNVYARGLQNLVQFRLPFDPSLAYHTYAIRWSSTQISWSIDGVPIRVLNYRPAMAWPMQSMRPQLTFAPTPWTALKPDYRAGPISALAQEYSQSGCVALDTDLGLAGRPQCAGAWNAPVPPAAAAAGARLRARQIIVDYGWDKA